MQVPGHQPGGELLVLCVRRRLGELAHQAGQGCFRRRGFQVPSCEVTLRSKAMAQAAAARLVPTNTI